MMLRGQCRTAMEVLIQSLFPDTKMGEMGPSLSRVLQKADDYLANTNRLSRLLFRFSLMFFDWAAFFYYRFERFSHMDERVRRRYISMWMNHKWAIFRNLFMFLRVVITVPYYDLATKSSGKK